MSEPATPWGALPYYQIHFVVMGDVKLFGERLVARTRKKTSGVIHKKITDVWWEGGSIADRLNSDTNLKALLKEVLLDEGDIYVDPVEYCVRIYGSWKPEYNVQISKKALEVYNAIAGHVKQFISELTLTNV